LGKAIVDPGQEVKNECTKSKPIHNSNSILYFTLYPLLFTMFKKRTRPAGARTKESASEEAGPSRSPPAPDSTTDEPEQDLTTEIDELILLRKLRKGKQGIDLVKFNKGEKKVARDDLGSGSGSYGLKKRYNEDDEPEYVPLLPLSKTLEEVQEEGSS
jgi:hypothetical protein